MVDMSENLQKLIRHGYVIAVAEVRGSGASFGRRAGEFFHDETLDAHDITQWLAHQPWSTGKIGMFGVSYLGTTQYLAASTAPPALKAIMPEMAMFDLYDFVFPNGAMRLPFVESWSQKVKHLDQRVQPVPVDDDKEGTLIGQALKERSSNIYSDEFIFATPYRDSWFQQEDVYPYRQWSPSWWISQINEAAIPVYHVAGWFDAWTKDGFLFWKNLQMPRRLIVGPWSHSGRDPFERLHDSELIATEQLRWFDYWLKGIDNGIMDEDPVYYYTMNAAEDNAWSSARQWPPAHLSATSFYLGGEQGGVLAKEVPGRGSSFTGLQVDYSASSGPGSRWANTHGERLSLPDMRINDGKGIHFLMPPLEHALTITGHPIISLYVSAEVDDFDLVVFLEDIRPDGYAQYLTEGTINSRYRQVQQPSLDYMGLPFRRGYSQDVSPSPKDSIFLLEFDLHPTSYTFLPGHSLRITITGADMHNLETTVYDPAPLIKIYHSPQYPSALILPVVTDDVAWQRLFLLPIALIILTGYLLVRIKGRKMDLTKYR